MLTIDQKLTYCEWVGTIALIIALYLWFGYSPYRKQLKKTIYQRELDRYHEIMKWYGFDGKEAADRLFEFKNYNELKDHNKRADKERKGRI